MSDVIGEILDSVFGSSDSKKKEIEGHLMRLGVSNYTIRKDKVDQKFIVDLNADVLIQSKKIEECPVNFGVAKGNFIWIGVLKSLRNFPKIVHGNLSVANNNLTTLLVDDKTRVVNVKGRFICSGNKLKNLRGSPVKCGSFVATNCDLESLDGAPEEIDGQLIVNHNKLTSLKGAPSKVKEIDCSDNLIETEGMKAPSGCKIIANNNPMNLEKQVHIDFDSYKKGDKVTIIKDDSKFKNLVGEIIDITEPTTDSPDRQYHVLIKKTNYPDFFEFNKYDKDMGLTLKGKYLKRTYEDFKYNDWIIYKNSKSKFDGFKGTIVSKQDNTYTVKFHQYNNPTFMDVVTNKQQSDVNVKSILPEHLERLNFVNVEVPKEDDFIIRNGLKVVPKNTFQINQEAMHGFIKVRIVGYGSPSHWNVYNVNDPQKNVYQIHYSNLNSLEEDRRFYIGDKIRYIDPYGEYDECTGEVIYASQRGGKQIIDVRILDKNSHVKYLSSVNPDNLEIDIWARDKKPDKFKLGDIVEYGNAKYEITKVEKNNYYTIKSFINGIEYMSISGAKLKLVEESTPEKKEFNVGDEVRYRGSKWKITSKEENIYNLDIIPTRKKDAEGTKVMNVSEKDLNLWDPNKDDEKIKGKFKKGDRIIYINGRDENYGKHGHVTKINQVYMRTTYDIVIELDNSELHRSYVGAEDLRHESEGDVDIPKREQKFQKGQKIIYIASGDKNMDVHLRRGTVTFVNQWPVTSPITYDINLSKEGNESYERRINDVPDKNLMPAQEAFQIGDKVMYHNQYDTDWNNKAGIVSKIGERKYEVTFNNGDTTMTIFGIDSSDLTKFVKPIGSQVHVDDEIIYTKPDSKHYGCKGTAFEYDLDTDRFKIEIKTKDGAIKKFINIKDENLELLPPARKYQKGDKIRYVNSNSPHDGLIGSVIEVVSPDSKNPSYNIRLKSEQGNVIITTPADYLLLLEEASDSDILKFGQPVKYIAPGSKYDGRIGKYNGERTKYDGTHQRSVKFDEGNLEKIVWINDEDGILEPAGEAPVAYVPPATTTARKKKKKEADEPLKPVLVYNRRNIAKKAYEKPSEESEEQHKK